jgi:CRISPR-associated protein Csx10
VITRVGINRRRGTAEEGQLFSPLVLSEVQPRSERPRTSHEPEERFMPTTFCGSVVLPENQNDLLETVTALHWLGGRVSTGIGQVEVQCSAPPEERPLTQRIDDLTTRCKEQAGVYAQLGGAAWDITGSIFTVNLLSDTILLEQGWLPTMVLTGDMLSTATHGHVQATLLRAFASYDYDGGWQVCWQRPKATHVVARMGSLYVFVTTDPLTSDQIEALEHLQLVGIGERVQEGFGQVRICDEFHLQEGVRL